MLPGTWISPSIRSFNAAISAITSPVSTVVLFQVGSTRVLDTTYFGMPLYLSPSSSWTFGQAPAKDS